MGSGWTKEDKLDISGKDVMIDCPILVDLGHGTIRHRMPDERTQNNAKIKTGYFYHAKLDDFSEDAVISNHDNFKFKYVFKGAAKAEGQRLFYVYGNRENAKDSGIQRAEYKPKGKGFNWPESYRKANNLYYDLTILPRINEGYESDDDTISVATDISSGNEIQNSEKENITVKVRKVDTVEVIKKRIAIRLLIPAINLHFLHDMKELQNSDIIETLLEDEEDIQETVLLNLRLL